MTSSLDGRVYSYIRTGVCVYLYIRTNVYLEIKILTFLISNEGWFETFRRPVLLIEHLRFRKKFHFEFNRYRNFTSETAFWKVCSMVTNFFCIPLYLSL